jgi:hypothetical protein
MVACLDDGMPGWWLAWMVACPDQDSDITGWWHACMVACLDGGMPGSQYVYCIGKDMILHIPAAAQAIRS